MFYDGISLYVVRHTITNVFVKAFFENEASN